MKIASTAFLMLLSVVAVAPQTKPPHPPPGKLIDLGGYRLQLNCAGNKSPAVVLIPGSGDFSFDWGLVQPGIAPFARVCSYDRAGFAWSDPGPTPRTMKQEAFELNRLLKAAHIKAPYVLVGHSLGGLIARVYAEQYRQEVAGVVLVDSTHEDTTLMLQGKLVHMRELAKPDPVPPVQTMKSSPPGPPSKEDLDQFESNLKTFGAPKIDGPFAKLPEPVQAMRLWFLSQPPRARGGPTFFAEELSAMYAARSKTPYQLGNLPLIVLLTKPGSGNPPPGIAADEWKRVNEEKRQQKIEFTNLSRNSMLILAERSGHHIHLDEPQVVIDAVRAVVEAVRQDQTLDGRKL